MSHSVTLAGARDDLPPGRVLAREFFARPSDQVAAHLIGKIVWRLGVGGGRLTEVEAYLPENDPACHAACGRTPRNAAMFGPAGRVYLYLSYGVHVLLNLVCDEEARGSAVLVRSFEPLGDTTQLSKNRAAHGGWTEPLDSTSRPRVGDYRGLSLGPGRVGQALGLHLGLNGLPLGEASGLYIIDDGTAPSVTRTTRVGISRGDQLPLRFYMTDNAFVTNRSRRRGASRDEIAGDVRGGISSRHGCGPQGAGGGFACARVGTEGARGHGG